MTRDKYLELFKKYVSNKIVIHEIELIPQVWSINGKILFTLKNPLKISYTKPVLVSIVQEKFLEFHAIIGTNFGDEYGDFEIIGQEIFIDEKLFKLINDALQKVQTLILGDIKVNVEHKSFEVELINNYEGVKFINNVSIIEGFFKDIEDGYLEVDVNYAKMAYNLTLKSSGRFDEHEKNYIELDGIFDDFPLFIDNDWQYFYFETNLI